MRSSKWFGLVLPLMLVACVPPEDGVDGGAGPEDSGQSEVDAGPIEQDAGATDAGQPGRDAGTPDAGQGGTTQVQIIVEPNGLSGAELVTAIKAAKTSVYMTMYSINDPDVLNALIARKKAGVEVKVVLNQSFPYGTNTNQAAYTKLTGGGVSVVWASSWFTYTHEKTVMMDHQTAWIMTMNCMNTSPTGNREYLAIDSDPADVQQAEALFQADFANVVFNTAGPLVISPDPPQNARTALVALIDSATSTLDVEVEEFSDLGYSGKTGVVTAVANAATRGVTVHVVLAAGTPSSNQVTAISQVKAAGAKVVVSGAQSGSGTQAKPYLHAKTILVDCVGTTCRKGFVGSENFSGGSLGYNRELGLFIAATSELAKIKTAVNADYASGTAQ
jgi:phosphatidylserine/phosphatidylglycerophosphate/cardiolipin synthase-like enzyme